MKVAVVSFAHERAATCVRLLRGMTGVKLLTADPGAPPDDPIRGRGVARELDVPYVDDWDEVFGWRPDAVLITSEVAHRRTLAERAAEIGARVLCEHPLAATEADAEAVVRACAGAVVRLVLASPACFSPTFAGLRRALADGELVGDLTTIHGTHNNPRRNAGDPSSAGALGANAPALLDMVDAVLGGEPADQVYAQTNDVLSTAAGVESAAVLTVRYSSGTVVSLDCSQSPPGDRFVDGPTMTFIGDRASVEFNTAPQLLGGYDAESVSQRWETGGTDLCSAMLDGFLGASSVEQCPDGAAALRAMRIVRAAYESVRTGQPVGVVAASATPAP